MERREWVGGRSRRPGAAGIVERLGAGGNLAGGVRIRDIIRTGYAQGTNTVSGSETGGRGGPKTSTGPPAGPHFFINALRRSAAGQKFLDKISSCTWGLGLLKTLARHFGGALMRGIRLVSNHDQPGLGGKHRAARGGRMGAGGSGGARGFRQARPRPGRRAQRAAGVYGGGRGGPGIAFTERELRAGGLL